MIVGVNWLTLYQQCPFADFLSVIVPHVHFGAFFHFDDSMTDDSTLKVVVASAGVRVEAAKSLICDLDRVSEWCDLWGMKFSLEVSHNASSVTPINYWRNCTEEV